MRMMIVYDLPMVTEEDKKDYNSFRKNLLKLGFYKLQFSIYVKVLQNENSFIQLSNKLKYIVPNSGSIIIFKVTEKQFRDMVYLKGFINKQESLVGNNEIVIFGGGSDET